jgi:hypothetical protein
MDSSLLLLLGGSLLQFLAVAVAVLVTYEFEAFVLRSTPNSARDTGSAWTRNPAVARYACTCQGLTQLESNAAPVLQHCTASGQQQRALASSVSESSVHTDVRA